MLIHLSTLDISRPFFLVNVSEAGLSPSLGKSLLSMAQSMELFPVFGDSTRFA
jgi:hypothetical protein